MSFPFSRQQKERMKTWIRLGSKPNNNPKNNISIRRAMSKQKYYPTGDEWIAGFYD